MLISIDRKVKEEAAKQIDPWSGWCPRAAVERVFRGASRPVAGVRSRIASGSSCQANVGELYGTSKGLSTSARG